MWDAYDKLNHDVKEYAGYKRMLKETAEKIDSSARELLGELQKIDGWECMIKHCRDHYEKCKNNFFGWCQVTHTEDSVQFVKGYSNGDEYEVLNISFKKSLKQQVRERMEEIENERRCKETETREKDLAELQRLRDKYGL